MSKNINSKDIIHKDNIPVKSQTLQQNASKRENERVNTHIYFRQGLSFSYCSLLNTMYYFKAIPFMQSWDSSVGIVNRLWARLPTIRVQFLAGSTHIFLLHSIQSGPGDHPASYSMFTDALSPKIVRSGLHTDRSPPPSIDAEGECSQSKFQLLYAFTVHRATTLPLRNTVQILNQILSTKTPTS
jgi:hypothetical protein